MTYCTFLEGEQAEAYKKRKASEKEANDRKYDKYQLNRSCGYTGKQFSNFNGNIPDDKKDAKQKYRKKLHKDASKYSRDDDRYYDEYEKTMDRVTGQEKDSRVRNYFNKRRDTGIGFSNNDFSSAYDASRRHVRRHAKNESAGIFDDVELI